MDLDCHDGGAVGVIRRRVGQVAVCRDGRLCREQAIVVVGNYEIQGLAALIGGACADGSSPAGDGLSACVLQYVLVSALGEAGYVVNCRHREGGTVVVKQCAWVGSLEGDGLSAVPVNIWYADGGHPTTVDGHGQAGVAAVGPGHLGVGVIDVGDIVIEAYGSEDAALSDGLIRDIGDYRCVVDRVNGDGDVADVGASTTAVSDYDCIITANRYRMICTAYVVLKCSTE